MTPRVYAATSRTKLSSSRVSLKEGDEVEVGLENGKVIIKPLIAIDEFKRELKGCVEISKIDPLKAKRIWEA
jgi:antitoxin component of MazEF toxin-antitoxin module